MCLNCSQRGVEDSFSSRQPDAIRSAEPLSRKFAYDLPKFAGELTDTMVAAFFQPSV